MLVAGPVTATGAGDAAGLDVEVPVAGAPATVVLVSVTGEIPPAGCGLAVAASRAPEHAAAKVTNTSGKSFCKCMVSIVWTGMCGI